MIRLRRWVLVAAVAAITGLAAFSWLSSPNTPSLLVRASRLLEVSSWKYSGRPSYYWLSNHELLLFKPERRSGTEFHVPTRYDLADKSAKNLRVSRVFASYRGYGIPYRTALSPDRKSLLWWGNFGHTYVGALDGSWHRSWKGWGDVNEWLTNTSFVQVTPNRGGATALIHSANSTSPPRQVRMNYQRSWNRGTSAGRLYTIDWSPIRSGVELSVTEHDFSRNPSASNSRLIQLPGATFVPETSLSSRADRIAVVTYGYSLSPIQQLLSRYLKVDHEPRIQLLTCRLDGSHRHLLGELPAPPTGPNGSLTADTDNFPLSLHWIPNTNRVSFVYRNFLWSLPDT